MRSNPLATDKPAVLDALLLVARHLRAHRELPEPHRISVDLLSQRVRCQMAGMLGWELGDLAAWADSLDESSMEVWRTPCGERFLVSVLGRTADGVPLEMFDGLSYNESLFGVVPANATRAVSRVELAEAAARSVHVTAEVARRHQPGGAR